MDVIALISGGKDSFYNILHCIKNGHRVVALANLHPPIPQQISTVLRSQSSLISTFLPAADETFDISGNVDMVSQSPEGQKEELDSLMYQTVGHKLIPLYANALTLPLYRAPIVGDAINQDLSYSTPQTNSLNSELPKDETEDLHNLLSYILTIHPTAKAVSTGAILSTYQRTRVESVCSRLNLISLSFLWQRPQVSLLHEMASVGLDARIVKVASEGLDPDRWLWENVATPLSINKLIALQKKYGVHTAGEGGEYETIVVNAPGFRRKIRVDDNWKKIIHCEGGVGYLKITNAKLEKDGDIFVKEQKEYIKELKIPFLLDEPSWKTLSLMRSLDKQVNASHNYHYSSTHKGENNFPIRSSFFNVRRSISINNITGEKSGDIGAEIESAMQRVSQILITYNTSFSSITSITLLLRSMKDFPIINQVYASYFPSPNPPARVCVGVGDYLSSGQNLMIHAQVDLDSTPWQSKDGFFTTCTLRKALHVQSRSYWAPANIGPYSQAISVDGIVALSGQIPLLPATMELPTLDHVPPGGKLEGQQRLFEFESILALQHLSRVSRAMQVERFILTIGYTTSVDAIKYINRALDIGVWKHKQIPLWDSHFEPGEYHYDGDPNTDTDILESTLEENYHEIDPSFIVLVDSLPRNASLEYSALGIDGPWIQDRIRDIENIEFDDKVPQWHFRKYQLTDETQKSGQVEITTSGIAIEWGAWDYSSGNSSSYSSIGPCGGKILVNGINFTANVNDGFLKDVANYILESSIIYSKGEYKGKIEVEQEGNLKWKLKPLSLAIYLPQNTATPYDLYSAWEYACKAHASCGFSTSNTTLRETSCASNLLQIIPIKRVWMAGKEKDVVYVIRYIGDEAEQDEE